MNTYGNAIGSALGGAGGPGRVNAPEPRSGSAIDSAIAQLEHITNLLNRLHDNVEQIANTTMGAVPTEVAKDRINHPPSTLQEWITYTMQCSERLEAQVRRFF